MDIILKHFPHLSKKQIAQYKSLYELYNYWNTKINLISRQDIQHIYERHVLHSLAIVKFIKFRAHTKILDIGTGGGFPGIPLAIYFPECRFYLNDSIKKKINVVNEIIKALMLSNTITIHSRAESIRKKYEFITSRAVTNFPKFVKISQDLISHKHNNMKKNGILYLKGGNFEDEILSFKNIQTVNITDYFHENYFETKKIIYAPVK